MVVEFRCRASAHDIRRHLFECDKDYLPRLSKRVDIDEYAQKLFASATRFEAWDDQQLVGLVAAYFPTMSTSSVFVSNVSVLPEFRGKGLGERLLTACIRAARGDGYDSLTLEVDASNAPAIGLYTRLGFEAAGNTEAASGEILHMALRMERKQP